MKTTMTQSEFDTLVRELYDLALDLHDNLKDERTEVRIDSRKLCRMTIAVMLRKIVEVES